MEETKIEKPMNDAICCEVLEKINLGWFRLSDNERCMPHIKDHNGEIMYRVNYCPSCGKNIRGLILEK